MIGTVDHHQGLLIVLGTAVQCEGLVIIVRDCSVLGTVDHC